MYDKCVNTIVIACGSKAPHSYNYVHRACVLLHATVYKFSAQEDVFPCIIVPQVIILHTIMTSMWGEEMAPGIAVVRGWPGVAKATPWPHPDYATACT